MEKQEVLELLTDLIPQLNKITIENMNGVKKTSKLTKSVGFEVTNTGIGLKANNYWFYVSDGRRARTKKVPITALIDYIKSYGISPRQGQTIGQLAFAIQTSIYKQGISPKNYADKIMDATGELTQEVMTEEVSTLIADDVVDVMLKAPNAKQI